MKTFWLWLVPYFTANLRVYVDAEDEEPRVIRFFGFRLKGWGGVGFHYVSKRTVSEETKARFAAGNN